MERKILSIVMSILIAVLSWTWSTTFSKLVEISKELKAVQMELVKINSTMLTKEEVKEMVIDELLRHGIIKNP